MCLDKAKDFERRSMKIGLKATPQFKGNLLLCIILGLCEEWGV